MNAPAAPETIRWLESFASALAQGDLRAATDLFAPECYWRDLVAFTWDIRTHEGRDEIRRAL
jgi:putative flavoprotein involved in K+ transport